MDPLNLAELEAETRRLMFAHSRIKARGFDSTRERQHLHRLIDQYLDQYLLVSSFADLDTA